MANLNSVLISEINCDTEKFYPFSILHPIFEIRFGAFRFFERIHHLFPDSPIGFEGRELHLQSFCERFEITPPNKTNGNCLRIHTNFLPNEEFRKFINELTDKNYIIKSGDIIIAELTTGNANSTEEVQFEAATFDSIWDLIYINEEAINSDFNLIKFKTTNIHKYDGVYFMEESNIKICSSVKIMPGVVIDASEGAVIIEDNVKIMAQATIIGPCHIGADTTIKIGAKIYEKTSIGNNCKVGGEVENTIIQSYSNKQHDGFLGHSFICEWVNLGADTNNSDLKNTYDIINLKVKDKIFETGKMFLGLFCGDHAKSAINTQFNTGTVTGIFGIIVKEGFPPTYIPSFAFGGKQGSPMYRLASSLQLAERVLARRKRTLTPTETELIKLEYDRTKVEG